MRSLHEVRGMWSFRSGASTARGMPGWQIALFGALLALNNLVNALSTNTDYARAGIVLAGWKPVVWELSSGLMILLLIPLLHWWLTLFPLTRARWWRSVPAHLLMTVPFSLVHVAGMVLLRKGVYRLAGDSYDFGPWWPNWRYEFNKDFATYCLILALLVAFHLYAQWRESAQATTAAGEQESSPPDRLMARKRNREYIVNVRDIDRIEADGNYVSLHVKDEVFPLRESLSRLEKRLDGSRFARVHRRHIVNIDRIREIQPWDNGDYRIVLEDGTLVNLSRRYRNRLTRLFH